MPVRKAPASKDADEASRPVLQFSQEENAAADMNSRGQTKILREDKQAVILSWRLPLLSSMTDHGTKGHGDNSAPAAWKGQAQSLQRTLP